MSQRTRWTVGAVTIGQSPRDDVLPDLEASLGSDCRIVQAGALDGLERRDLSRLTSWWHRGHFVTRLRDGVEVRLRKEVVLERLQESVNRLETDVDLIVLLCTGEFPEITTRCPILRSGRILRQAVRELEVRCLGVLTPAANQVRAQHRRWREFAEYVTVAHASPYGPLEQLRSAAEELRASAVDAVVMDCIGYTRRMRHEVQELSGRPALSVFDRLGPAARKLLGSVSSPSER